MLKQLWNVLAVLDNHSRYPLFMARRANGRGCRLWSDKTAKKSFATVSAFCFGWNKFLFQLCFICADSCSGGYRIRWKGSAAKIRPIADSLKDSTTRWLLKMHLLALFEQVRSLPEVASWQNTWISCKLKLCTRPCTGWSCVVAEWRADGFASWRRRHDFPQPGHRLPYAYSLDELDDHVTKSPLSVQPKP